MKHNYLKSLFLMLMMCVGMSAWAEEVTWTASSAGYENQAEVSNVTVNSNISLTFDKGTNNNASKYYTSGTAVRAYGGNTIAVNATNATITGVTFTFGSSDGSNAITANVGSFTSPNWSGSASAVTFTIGGTTGNRRISAVKVTYTTGETTNYTVTVANDIANGTVSASPTSAAEGATVTLTATPSTGYEFGSWNVTNASTSEAITVTDNKFTMPAANVNVSATFNEVQSGETEEGTTVTWIASEQGYTNGTQYNSATVDENISLAFGDGVNDGKYYDTGTGIRIYSNGKLTVSAANGGTISKIVITYSEKANTGTFSASTGNYRLSETVGTWTGSASSVELTNTASSGHARVQKIEVTYNEGNTQEQKTITAIAVSGTPTKTTYNVGDAFETAGLVVTATYSDETTAPITTGFVWEIDYGTGNTALVAGATSVDVMVYTEDQEVMSEVYTVNGLTVTVPVALTSIAVSGTPTKTAYYVGDAFETAGLVVTGTYSDSHQETITEGIEWTIDPETLDLGTTSVDVMAGVGEVVSEIYTVEGLTVTENPNKTVTYNFSSFESNSSIELTDLEGFVITLKGNEGTNPAWSSNQARVYASGSLTVKANNAIIKSIEYTYVVNKSGSGKIPTIDGVKGTTDNGKWNKDDKIWTGADEEVTFSTSGTAGNVGFTKLIIKYVEKNLIETSLAWSADEAEVTIGAGDNVFPTLTTTPTDLDGVTYESSNTAVATIAEDGTITLLKEGVTTITASYDGDAEHASATPVSYTLTVNKAPFVPTPVADGYETVDFAALYSSVSSTATVEDYEGTSFAMAFAKPDGSSNPTKYYDNGKAVRAYVGNTITITGAEKIKYVDIAWAGTYVDDAVSITGLGSTTAVVTFSKTCRFTDITVVYSCPSLTISAAGYATYYNATDYKMPVGLEGKIMKEVEGTVKSVVAYEAGAVVPAETALLLKGEAGNYPLIPTSKEGKTAEGNLLKGNLTEGPTTGGDADAKYYKFANGDNGLGWYYGSSDNTDGHAFTIGANKAYLVINGSSKVKALSFVSIEDNEEDAIKNVEEKTFDTVIYDMQGRKVSKAQKGLYIINGRKMVK